MGRTGPSLTTPRRTDDREERGSNAPRVGGRDLDPRRGGSRSAPCWVGGPDRLGEELAEAVERASMGSRVAPRGRPAISWEIRGGRGAHVRGLYRLLGEPGAPDAPRLRGRGGRHEPGRDRGGARACYATAARLGRLIRDNLDLGRPDRVQLIFERRITQRTPGAFRTRVIQIAWCRAFTSASLKGS